MSSIYILRHEERPSDKFSQYVDLTRQGMYNANFVLAPKLLQMSNFDPIVYSSPYSRTLETIAPYVSYKHSFVNVEPALAEGYAHKPLAQFDSLINYDYTPVVPYVPEEIKITSIGNVNDYHQYYRNSINLFLDSLEDNGNTYLLVSHLPVINIFLSIIKNEPIMNQSYSTGTLLGPFSLGKRMR